jgi:hypothetical protein
MDPLIQRPIIKSQVQELPASKRYRNGSLQGLPPTFYGHGTTARQATQEPPSHEATARQGNQLCFGPAISGKASSDPGSGRSTGATFAKCYDAPSRVGSDIFVLQKLFVRRECFILLARALKDQQQERAKLELPTLRGREVPSLAQRRRRRWDREDSPDIQSAQVSGWRRYPTPIP